MFDARAVPSHGFVNVPLGRCEGGPLFSGKHVRGGPPVDDRGCNDRDKRERRAARDCRDSRAAAYGAVSVFI